MTTTEGNRRKDQSSGVDGYESQSIQGNSRGGATLETTSNTLQVASSRSIVGNFTAALDAEPEAGRGLGA